MNSFTVGMDGSQTDHPVRVKTLRWFCKSLCTARRSFFPGFFDIRNFQSNDLYAIAMPKHVITNFAVRLERRGYDEPDLSLLKDVAGSVSYTGFEARVRDRGEPHRLVVKV